MKASIRRMVVAGQALLLSLTALADGLLTRGIGQYPGHPQENFAPIITTDTTYRNLALHRRAWHSSAYDYNLTAQLVTDGYLSGRAYHLDVFTPEGLLPRREREWTLDGNDFSRNVLMGDTTWMDYRWNYSATFDSIEVVCQVAYDESLATNGYRISLSDGRGTPLAEAAADTLPGLLMPYRVHSDPNKQEEATLLPMRLVRVSMKIPQADVGMLTQMRLDYAMQGAAHWSITQVRLYHRGEPTDLLPSARFSSAWMSEGMGDEWIAIDLGAEATVNEVKVWWLQAARRWHIETSTDGNEWTQQLEAAENEGNTTIRRSTYSDDERTDSYRFKSPVAAQFIRLRMTEPPSSGRYAISEVEVFGRGGTHAEPHPREGLRADGTFSLNGGEWHLRHEAANYGLLMPAISQADTPEARNFGGIVATVPATVLTSFVNAEAVPNPNFDDDMLQLSESFFRQPFIYRTEFRLPADFQTGRNVMLCMDGINWKAELWLNGQYVGRIDGAFRQGQFDVTRWLRAGTNALAVRVVNNAHFGSVKEKNEVNTDFNGGILGADNPTFHSSIGWDWISTIRGRNMGIWNDVYLKATGPVLLNHPFLGCRVEEAVREPMYPAKNTIDTRSKADGTATLTPTVVARNLTDSTQTALISCWIGTGIRAEQTVSLQPHEEREVTFLPPDFPQLNGQRLRLWWPNGYGEPYLYEAGFSVETGDFSDRIDYKAGIREVKCTQTDTALQLYVNGIRVVPLGGNWGFSEHNLNYRGREYDAAVAYHHDMNFTMIRNWVGQTGDSEFYEACDRHGILVWQDFWLANPSDGPNPTDEAMFMDNAADLVGRIRQHPSVALYCGRNEGYPTPSLDRDLRQLVATEHPGLTYISSSADDGVSGHGPYWVLSRSDYFRRSPQKLHSERGMPCVMSHEGLGRTLRPEHRWPQDNVWGQHDYVMRGAQRGAIFNDFVHQALGQPASAEQFCQWAQWVNYDGYRAMFESANSRRQGLVIWMSHAAFPSMVWQTYDYYLEPTSAFFAARKACEPIHIQWNALTDSIEVVNTRGGNHGKLVARAYIYNMYGQLLGQQKRKFAIAEDQTRQCIRLKHPKRLTDAYFLRLVLTDPQDRQLSENTYICGTTEGNYQALHELPNATVESQIRWDDEQATVTLRNTSPVPALMLRLNLKATDGDQILPVSYSDNYFHLLPGEEKTVDIGWKRADARGQNPQLTVEGFNLANR